MYNEDLKTRFVREYTSSISKAQYAVNVFNAFESHERNQWKDDLCTRSAEELQPIIDKLVGIRYESHWAAASLLKEYIEWCIDNQVPGARNGMQGVNISGLKKIQTCMVSGPLHLQRYLNDVFEKEEAETVHNLYRCYYWMAFSGLYEEDIFGVTERDVIISDLTIKYKGSEYPIYREAIPAFKNAISLTGFYYLHPKYSEIIRRDRVAGDILLRGFRGNMKLMTLRTTLSIISSNAIKNNKTELQLSYSRVWLSGLFYRTYEKERAGFDPYFVEAAIKNMEGKTYKNSDRQLTKLIREYNRDYQRWKLAFSI